MTMTYNQPRSPPPQGPPGAHEQNDPRYSQFGARSPNYTNHTYPEPDRYRPAEASTPQRATFDADATGYIQVRQPINDAVASGISATENTNGFSPDMISKLTSQITASVLEQLKGQSIPSTAIAPVPAPAAPTAASPIITASPPIDRHSLRTPPSPYRASEEAAQTPVSPTHANFSFTSYAPSSPPQNRRAKSPLNQADDIEPLEDRAVRPRGPKRISTSGDATIIEKTWGTLFMEDGKTTVRLGQFLRGIAVHLIEDYEPKHSLVITPSKMQKYYEDTKVSNEVYSWTTVFDDRTSSISRLYREFEIQHHLVQDRLDKRPQIPGLTPHGFEKWATTLLLAHPDQEFDRLSKTALEMPISNPDDRKERFPKEISRRLFPKEPDNELVSKLQKALHTHCGVSTQPRRDSQTESDQQPPQTSYRVDDLVQLSPTMPTFAPNRRQDTGLSPVTSRISPPPNYSGSEREHRNPRSNAPSDAAISEDGDDMPTPQPIERERKPYVAQPGGGKTYDDFERSGSMDYAAGAPEIRPARTMSMSYGQPLEPSRSRVAPIAIHQRPPPPPMDGGEIRHTRTNSSYTRDPHGRNLRPRSPSLSANGKDYGHRSESDVAAYSSSHHSATSADATENARRYQEYELQRERNAGDRFDPARMAAYDPRERDRDPRTRLQSTAGMESGRNQYANDDEYFRTTGAVGYPSTRDPYQQQYPPNSYTGRP